MQIRIQPKEFYFSVDADTLEKIIQATNVQLFAWIIWCISK